jgi:hypothetical protein
MAKNLVNIAFFLKRGRGSSTHLFEYIQTYFTNKKQIINHMVYDIWNIFMQ